MCRLCSQLCRRTPAPATSPLPLSAFVRSTERRFYTEMIAQQRLCVANKKAPPINDHRRSLPLHRKHTHSSQSHQPTLKFSLVAFFLRMTSWWIPFQGADMNCGGPSGEGGGSLVLAPGPGSAYLAPNCFWLMEGPFYVTYATFRSQEGDRIGWCLWVMLSQGHNEQGERQNERKEDEETELFHLLRSCQSYIWWEADVFKSLVMCLWWGDWRETN